MKRRSLEDLAVITQELVNISKDNLDLMLSVQKNQAKASILIKEIFSLVDTAVDLLEAGILDASTQLAKSDCPVAHKIATDLAVLSDGIDTKLEPEAAVLVEKLEQVGQRMEMLAAGGIELSKRYTELTNTIQ